MFWIIWGTINNIKNTRNLTRFFINKHLYAQPKKKVNILTPPRRKKKKKTHDIQENNRKRSAGENRNTQGCIQTTVDVERAEVSQQSAVFGEKHRRDREDAWISDKITSSCQCAWETKDAEETNVMRSATNNRQLKWRMICEAQKTILRGAECTVRLNFLKSTVRSVTTRHISLTTVLILNG